MAVYRKDLAYDTTSKNEVIPINDDVKKVVRESGIKNGMLFLYSLHTTLSVINQESIEPNLCQDFITQLVKIVDDDGSKYMHTCAKHPSGTCSLDKGNGPSHTRQLITNQNVMIDIKNGELCLGRWQDLALLELDGPRKERKIHIKVVED